MSHWIFSTSRLSSVGYTPAHAPSHQWLTSQNDSSPSLILQYQDCAIVLWHSLTIIHSGPSVCSPTGSRRLELD